MDQIVINVLAVIILGGLMGLFFGLFLLGRYNGDRPLWMSLWGIVLGVVSIISPIYSYATNPPANTYSVSYPWGATYVFWVATAVFGLVALITWLIYDKKRIEVKND